MSNKIFSTNMLKKSLPLLKRFFGWLKNNWLANNILSAIVGFFIGVLLTWAFTGPKPIYYEPGLNGELGIHQAKSLYDLAKEKENINIDFEPSELRNIAICGFSSFAEETYQKLVEKYFQTYSNCFEMKHENNSNNFTVSIPSKSNKITSKTLKNGETQYFCNCLSSIVELGVDWLNNR